MIVPAPVPLATVTLHPVGVAPGVSGWGRLERNTGSAPLLAADRTPPPVATSPGAQLAGVDTEPAVVTAFPVRTTTVGWDCRPTSRGFTASSLSRQTVRSLIVELPRVKPRLRGWSHEIAFYCAMAAVVVLVWYATPGLPAVAAALYGASVVLLFGMSALYHRPTWEPAPRARLRRLDHAAIFVLIGGSDTPMCLLALAPSVGYGCSVSCGAGACSGS